MSVPHKLVQQILLRPNEKAIDAWRASLFPIDAAGSLVSTFTDSRHAEQPSGGFLVATNRRFVFLEEKGTFTKSYNVKTSVDYAQVRGSGFYGSILKCVMLSVDYQGRTERLRFGGFASINPETLKSARRIQPVEMKPILDKIVNEGLAEIENEKKRERVQYVLDFSFLKSKMEQGGLVLGNVKCPSCSASIPLPKNGTTFKCQYCGSTIYAQDVFDKMKGLIGGP